jgi:hypothetical protein
MSGRDKHKLETEDSALKKKKRALSVVYLDLGGGYTGVHAAILVLCAIL